MLIMTHEEFLEVYKLTVENLDFLVMIEDLKNGFEDVEDYEILSLSKFGNEELNDIFTTKYRDWKYEKELRIIDYNKNGNRKFKKKLLKTIYFGCKATEINIKHIIQLCQINGFSHVIFKKAKLISGKFELDFDEINKNDYLES